MSKKKFIKICGITSTQDAQMVCSYRSDDTKNPLLEAVGFILYPPSPRNIALKKLEEISKFVAKNFPTLVKVGVVVNAQEQLLQKIAPFVDAFQLHGDETPEHVEEIKKKFPDKKIWKALAITDMDDIQKIAQYSHADVLLLDAFCGEQRGGSGKKIPSKFLPQIQNFIPSGKKFVIAGGVNTQNFAQIFKISGADGIDLSSALEGNTKGKKSPEKVEEFFHSFSA